MAKYPIGLACDDVFLNTNLFKNRELTKRECIELIKQEIIQAHRLGFKIIRLVSMVPAWILEPCLPTAEKYDVCMCIELHGGLGFGVEKTEEYLREMVRLDSHFIQHNQFRTLDSGQEGIHRSLAVLFQQGVCQRGSGAEVVPGDAGDFPQTFLFLLL